MGLLDQLWDDTLAGPPPDSGLGKLRKHPTFSFRSNSGKELEVAVAAPAAEEPRVTRSIMIRRPAGSAAAWNGTPPLSPAAGNGTPPLSPAGSTPPVSPFSGGGGKQWNRFRRKSSSDAYEGPAGMVGVGPRNPPPYEV